MRNSDINCYHMIIIVSIHNNNIMIIVNRNIVRETGIYILPETFLFAIY
jgi:hypothetical protein